MSQEEPLEETTRVGEQVQVPATDTAVFGERVVLSGLSDADPDEMAVMQEYANVLLEVLAGAKDLDRGEVAERVEMVLARAGRDPHSIEVDEITDKVLRGTYSSLTVLTGDGVVLGYADGEGAPHAR